MHYICLSLCLTKMLSSCTKKDISIEVWIQKRDLSFLFSWHGLKRSILDAQLTSVRALTTVSREQWWPVTIQRKHKSLLYILKCVSNRKFLFSFSVLLWTWSSFTTLVSSQCTLLLFTWTLGVTLEVNTHTRLGPPAPNAHLVKDGATKICVVSETKPIEINKPFFNKPRL